MNDKLCYVLLMFAIVAPDSFAVTLSEGITQKDPNWQVVTGFLYQKGYYPYAAYLNTAQSELIVMRNGVSVYDLSTKMKKYGKKFARTADDSKDEIRELSRANSVGSDETSENSFMMGTEHDALGCLWDTPLRYGDIEQDGPNEIVAILGRDETQPSDRRLDLVIFSPQKQSVSFSIRLAREDIGGTLTENFPEYIKLPDSGALPQLISTDMRGIGNPAMRYYAKLFFGDFDKNGTPDIIAWRKRYDSRPISDSVQGYVLTAQLLTHYELTDGLYKAMSTEEPTIQTWLTDNALTWKKGYPDVSECTADNGGPIPEMSDPLLNDPDVLQ